MHEPDEPKTFSSNSCKSELHKINDTLSKIKCSIDAAKRKGVAAFNLQPLDIFGEPCRDRTDNLLIKSQLLYQLS